MRRLALALLLLLLALPALAVEPDEMLEDPALEARAREISQGLRCLVCQNQSIDDSNAELARDLRLLLRERLAAGDSDEEAIGYIVARYGDFVLLKPPVKASTWALWFGPAFILAIAGFGAAVYLRRRGRAAAAGEGAPPLTEAERARLAALLDEGEGR